MELRPAGLNSQSPTAKPNLTGWFLEGNKGMQSPYSPCITFSLIAFTSSKKTKPEHTQPGSNDSMDSSPKTKSTKPAGLSLHAVSQKGPCSYIVYT